MTLDHKLNSKHDKHFFLNIHFFINMLTIFKFFLLIFKSDNKPRN